MLTIFSIPKPFAGHIGVIQRNALNSWSRLRPKPKIFILGNEFGVAEAARDLGIVHLPEIKVNEFGTPYVSDAFAKISGLTESPFVMFTNADMMYNQTLISAIGRLKGLDRFLLSGRRWDLDQDGDLGAISDEDWARHFNDCHSRSKLHDASAMDYFVFPSHMPIPFPPLVIGRPGWDNWLVWQCRGNGTPVIDGTESIAALHQNHSYASLRLGAQHKSGPERILNVRAAGGLANMLTLREATHRLVDGRLRAPAWKYLLTSRMADVRLYQLCLGLKRWAQQAFYR